MRPISIKKNRAYSLTEMALVLLIITLMYSTVTPVYFKVMDEKKGQDASTEMLEISFEIDNFFDANGYFPESLDEVFDPIPLDPWGNPYQYLNIKDQPTKAKGKLRKDKNLVPINSDYDLYSMGPDGKSATPLTANISKDDIVRGRNGDFFGEAVDY